MTLIPDHLIFLDIEASGLGEDSWPIEVGLAWIDDNAIHTWSSLISPEPYWNEKAWSDQAALIHKIPRDALRTAPRSAHVAQEVMERIATKHVISDAPGFDRFWMERLFETIDRMPHAFTHIREVVASVCRGNPDAAKQIFAELEDAPRPHRAGADAARLATAILHGMQFGHLD